MPDFSNKLWSPAVDKLLRAVEWRSGRSVGSYPKRNVVGRRPHQGATPREHHPGALGKLFREPAPHLHSRIKGEPRYPFAFWADSNPILDFLEFVYLNHAYEVWFSWAREVCDANGLLDELTEVAQLFSTGSAERLLTMQREKLRKVREALWAAKRQSYLWRLEHDLADVLTYWPRS